MKTFWPFVIAGLTSGSLYGLAAMGLVLTYKTSGIFNFAHGAVAAAAAYLFYELHTQQHVAWPVAAALCIFVAAPVAGLVIERIARDLADAPTAAKIVATVGLLLVVQGTLTTIYGAPTINFAQFLPTHSYRIAGVSVGADQLIAMAIALVAAGGLYVFFRSSRLGIAMRGVVDNPDLLDLGGTSPVAVRRRAWIIGAAFAALSGILLAPYVGLDAVLLTLLVVQAFGAAAVGLFSSLPLTYAGGLFIGVGAALATKYVVDVPNLAGFPPSFPFIVLFAVLLLVPRGRLVEAGGGVKRRVVSDREPLPPRLVWGGRALLVIGLLAVPEVVGARLPVYTNAVIFVVIFLSLRLLVRTSGQVSLCHAAFAAVGAAAFCHFSSSGGLGLPWLVALLLAGAVAVPIGAFIAIPAIRLSGLFLALATFGFGILVERMGFPTGLMFGVFGSRQAPRPGDFLGLTLHTDTGFYYVCLAVALAACAAVYFVNRSRLGRLLLAMADSPTALVTHGASVNVTRALVFCISAGLAAVAGGLFAALTGSISGAGFNSLNSLLWLTVLVIAGSGETSAAFIAAFLLAVVPSYVNNQSYTDLQPVLFGVVAIGAGLAQGGRFPLSTWFAQSKERHGQRAARSPVASRRVAVEA